MMVSSSSTSGSQLSHLGKPELRDMLRRAGEEPHPRWTSKQICDRIKILEVMDMEVDWVMNDLNTRAEKLGLATSTELKRRLMRRIHNEIDTGRAASAGQGSSMGAMGGMMEMEM